jgi:hypothetical protein
MHTAPSAPSEPARVAVITPVVVKPFHSPCEVSAPTGTSTAIRK